ncbi:MAG: granule-associated-like protein [Betaproteobacteria bacterium RIFCSPLOWO2_12_FULL_66_14]|nr:MAG: granule-associated-like protein [Betaproteobacteria bacterium RIFCSPLOWO2_12_FULL_66_14]
MYVTPEQIIASNKAGAEALLGLAKAQFAAFERLSALNMNAAKSAFEESAGYTRALLGAKDIQEVANLNASAAQPALEKMLSYSRGVYEASTQAQGEMTKVLEVQTAELTRNMASFLDKFAKSAPAGSDVAVAAVKSAMAAANTAYDSFTKVARQATEMAEANFSAAAAAAKQPQKKAA